MRHVLDVLTAITVCLSASALAQEGGSTVLEGHSGHGEVFNEGPRQSAYLLENPTSVHLTVTVASERLQRFFDQGLGHLHGFWYFEAERTFRQIAAEDPDCAMAYWGMAMANVDHPERAAGFARVAWLKRGLVGEHERMYIDAIARFHGVEGPEEPEPEEEDGDKKKDAKDKDKDKDEVEDKDASESDDEDDDKKPVTRAQKKADKDAATKRRAEEKKRAAQLVKDYEEIIWEYPDDIEAKAFLANRLWMNRRRGLAITSRQANEALLQQVFAAQPMHPAHHYRIHLWDAEDSAERVVESAVKSGPSWPTIAHMWHMGGHIFARLGRHTDAAWQQEASARVDHAHMIRDWVLPDQIHNFAHNNEWLSRSMRHHGRVREAVTLAKNMIEMPRHPKYNKLSKRGCSASWGRIRLLETLELFEQWDELADLAETMYLEPSEDATDGALRAFALGKAFAHMKNDFGFDEQIQTLESMLARSKKERSEALDEAEEAALSLDFETDDVRGAMDDALASYEDELGDVRNKLKALRALRAVLKDEDVEDNLKALDKLRFEKAHLARLYLDAGVRQESDELKKKAVETARKALDRRDGQLYPHATLAHVLAETGEMDEALEVFDELREWTARADLDLPVFRRLAPLATERGLPADWRVEATVPEDVGERTDLARLGPLRWTPPFAPEWTAPDAFGGEIELADFDGRPVIVIFFLGFSCVHCVEQLQEFAPEYEKFTEAGIEIVTIGTNTVEELERSFGSDPDDTGYPFQVLADPDFDAFKRYRAYDDFEDVPLHGTFLVDGDGRVRWQDISYEPFMEPEFLLEESKRLLGLDPPKATTSPAASTTSSAAAAGQ